MTTHLFCFYYCLSNVYQGNASDSTALIYEITKIKKDFGLSEIIIVGDHGMIIKTHLEDLKSLNIQWMTALRSNSIKKAY